MSTRKSRRKKSRRKPKPVKKRDQLQALKRRLEQGPLRGERIVYSSSNRTKMSEVLGDFVEPYLDFADTEEANRKLLTLAVLAWNASLLPEDKQQSHIDEMLEEGLPSASRKLKTRLKEIVNIFLERKKAHFSENKRGIIDFELTDSGNVVHLTVVSTIEESEASFTRR